VLRVPVYDERKKLAIELGDEVNRLKTVAERLDKKCVIDIESLKAIHEQIKAEKVLVVAEKNVLWQEVVAALNRRQCVSNELADELIKGEWRI